MSTLPLGLLGGVGALVGALITLLSCFLPHITWFGLSANEWDIHPYIVLLAFVSFLGSGVLLLMGSGYVPVDATLRRVVAIVLLLLTAVMGLQWLLEFVDVNDAVTGAYSFGGASRGIGLFTQPLGILLLGAGSFVALIAPSKPTA